MDQQVLVELLEVVELVAAVMQINEILDHLLLEQ